MNENGMSILDGALTPRLLGQLQIEISVELGEVLISAAELFSMKPGTTIEIALDDSPLALKISGETIGYGVLRRDGDDLFLDVVSFASSTGETSSLK